MSNKKNKDAKSERPLYPFSGYVYCPHETDQEPLDHSKRCVIFAYSKKHAEELTFMLLPPQKDSDRFKNIEPGCRDYERAYGKYPGIYVYLRNSGIRTYERLDRFYLRPQSFSKNTQRKVGIEIGATYMAGHEVRIVGTITGQPEDLETLGLYETGDDLKVYFTDGTSEAVQSCTVKEFKKWMKKGEAKITEVHVRQITLKHNEKCLLEAACDALSVAEGTEGLGDVVNAVMVDELRAKYAEHGGYPERMYAAINSLRHMALIQFDGLKVPEGYVPDSFDFWITGKGWCHYSKWEDQMILTIKGGDAWDDKHLEFVDPEIRKQFLKARNVHA